MANELTLDRVLSVPVPILSNSAILMLMEAGKIEIANFDGDKLAPTAYQLSPHWLRFVNEDEDGLGPPETIVTLGSNQKHRLRPGEHVIITPRESIFLEKGFVGDFYPSSWCIERRLILVAGRLDAGYRQDLVFGLYNAGRRDVDLHSQVQIARVTFSWLGADNQPVYRDSHPGAYIPQLDALRKRTQALDEVQAQLDAQKKEISLLRSKLLNNLKQQ